MTAGGVCVWGRVEWGGGLPLKSQKNTVSGSSCQQTCHFFCHSFPFYLSLHSRPDKCFATYSEAKMGGGAGWGRGDEVEEHWPPEAGEEQMLGGWNLAEA